MKTEEEKDFEQGVFRVACPTCGYEQYYHVMDIDLFFICPKCGEFAWLKYHYLDRRHGIIYGLQLVKTVK